MKTILTEYEKNEHSKEFKELCFYTLYKDGYAYYLKFTLAPVRYDNGFIFTGCARVAQNFELVNGRQKTLAAVERQSAKKNHGLKMEALKSLYPRLKKSLNNIKKERF